MFSRCWLFASLVAFSPLTGVSASEPVVSFLSHDPQQADFEPTVRLLDESEFLQISDASPPDAFASISDMIPEAPVSYSMDDVTASDPPPFSDATREASWSHEVFRSTGSGLLGKRYLLLGLHGLRSGHEAVHDEYGIAKLYRGSVLGALVDHGHDGQCNNATCTHPANNGCLYQRLSKLNPTPALHTPSK